LKKLRVRWSEPASLDLFEIIEFIQLDRPAAAREVGRSILVAASHLKDSPRRGKVVPELLERGITDYRQIPISPYHVIYAVRGDSLDIEAVIDSRRDIQAWLFERLIR
jgi:plasmid stabilization system protein ParE